MAGFTITSPTNRVVLDRRREGKAAFTVINQTGHRARAQTYIVAVGTTDPRWLSVVGDAERDLLVDAAEPISVEVAVPMDAPAGQYPFRLDVASVDMPNEEWGRGPVVTFDCPEPEKPPEPETEPPGYIETAGGALAGALAAGVLIVGFIGPVFGFYGCSFFRCGPNLPALAFADFLLWLGVTVGAFLLLRFRDFHDPWITAVAMAVLALFVVLPIGWIGLTNVWIGTVVLLLFAVGIVALAGRAFARWRQVGHL